MRTVADIVDHLQRVATVPVHQHHGGVSAAMAMNVVALLKRHNSFSRRKLIKSEKMTTTLAVAVAENPELAGVSHAAHQFVFGQLWR